MISFTFHCGDFFSEFETDNSPKPLWHKADFISINAEFDKIDWDSEFDRLDVESSWDYFKNKFEDCVSQFVPVRTSSECNKPTKQPWFRKREKEAVRKKAALFREYRRSGSYVDKLEYIKQRNLTDDIIKKAKQEYESEIMRCVKTQPKKFYSYVRSKQKMQRFSEKFGEKRWKYCQG